MPNTIICKLRKNVNHILKKSCDVAKTLESCGIFLYNKGVQFPKNMKDKEINIMAEKKKHTIVNASTGHVLSEKEKEQAQQTAQNYHLAKPTGKAGGKRAGAIILWVLALGFEVLAIFELLQGKPIIFNLPTLAVAIGALVLDLVCVIIGSQLWKKANHIAPASEKNKFLFWLYNNLGVIMSIAAFLPFIILILTDKNSDKKTKTIAVIVAAAALLIGGFSSYDYNPVSQEDMTAASELLGDSYVYWAPYGHVYHTHEDCQALNQSDELSFGTVDQAMEANKTRLCSFCAKKDDITTLATDNANVDDAVIETGTHDALTVYWADGVEDFHMDPDCEAFDDVETLISGTIEEAQAAGHTSACQKCGN